MAEPDPQAIADSANLAYVEQLYARYLEDPQGVEPAWRQVFEGWAGANGNGHGDARGVGPRFARRSIFHPSGGSAAPPAPLPADAYPKTNGHTAPPRPLRQAAGASDESGPSAEVEDASLQHRVDMLVRNYRVRGHLLAQLDPLTPVDEAVPELSPAWYGFTEADFDQPFFFTSTVPGQQVRTLREIDGQLRNTYCSFIGVQFMHIDDLGVRQWLQRTMESTENTIELSRKEQIRILTRLTDAVIFEQFIQRKFIGAKSFSLEGAETLIPLLDLAFERLGEQQTKEVVIGMAHRGRLNVLANILGKSPQKIFREFEDIDPKLYMGGGDVKYHLGYSGDWRTRGGRNIHLSLCFNPSHLEFVNPVALGRLRAKQDRSGLETRGERGVGLLIHGDAAFAGEGVVQETLNLSEVEGYTTGGTIHVVVNNQIGFTTKPGDGRSGRYATDVAKMLQSPIFHVNGESPEAVAQVVRVALDFRQKFKRDVFIDMYCYRRRGHNEGDEPSFTQPEMYEKIDARKPIRESYLDHLMKLGGVSEDDAERIAERRTELLEKELTVARSDAFIPRRDTPRGLWAGYFGGRDTDVDEADTGIAKDRAAGLLHKLTELPDDFHIHPKLKKLLSLKAEMAEGERPLDWAAAELLAFASLATQGHRIRMSGQDSQRGTFSQRHAVLHDVNDGHTYMPLQHLSDEQAAVDIYNSTLSEAGVLGFEYGYSLDYPCGLTIWEAQFGDFTNAAQVILDQFIASAEDKWKRLSGITLLLPHGFEGQGPEHSSARLERFLMSASEDNIQVVQPTTPAQHFHLLRRQVVRRWRKPLIVMTPKSLLRHPKCVSPLEDFTAGRFQRVIPDAEVSRGGVSRVLLCTGKVYYELLQRREKLDRDDVAIIRLEQMHPFPEEPLREALARYGDGTPVFWVQEEPKNMGAWPFLRQRFCGKILDRLPFHGITRKESASPATGSKAAHQLEQDRLLNHAFTEG